MTRPAIGAALEAPQGRVRVSDGPDKAYKCEIRAPSFAHLQAMDYLSPATY